MPVLVFLHAKLNSHVLPSNSRACTNNCQLISCMINGVFHGGSHPEEVSYLCHVSHAATSRKSIIKSLNCLYFLYFIIRAYPKFKFCILLSANKVPKECYVNAHCKFPVQSCCILFMTDFRCNCLATLLFVA